MNTHAAAIAAAAAALLAAAATGLEALGHSPRQGPRESAGAFVERILREEVHGRWGEQWNQLNPGHQRLLTRAQYVRCSRGLGTELGNERLHVEGTRAEALHAAGVPERSATVVTVTMTDPGTGRTATFHIHAIAVGARWTWILGRPFLDAVAHGRCPDGSPLEHRPAL
jgi:hypothetical protein